MPVYGYIEVIAVDHAKAVGPPSRFPPVHRAHTSGRLPGPHAHDARQVAACLTRTHAVIARPRPRSARRPHGSRSVVLLLKQIESVVAPFHARRRASLSPLPRTPVRT
jgi:hypothetical protein